MISEYGFSKVNVEAIAREINQHTAGTEQCFKDELFHW